MLRFFPNILLSIYISLSAISAFGGSFVLNGQEYRFIKQVGSGGYGNVYWVGSGGRKFAAKVNTRGGLSSEMINPEVFFNDFLAKHNNRQGINATHDVGTVKILGDSRFDPSKSYLVEISALRDQSLRRYAASELRLSKLTSAETVEERLERSLRVVTDLLAGLTTLHKSGYIHRDIKTDNILVTSDGRAEIIDWGLVLNIKERSLGTKKLVGTPAFVDIDLLRSMRFQFYNDYASLGAIIFGLLTGFDSPITALSSSGKLSASQRQSEGLTTSFKTKV